MAQAICAIVETPLASPQSDQKLLQFAEMEKTASRQRPKLDLINHLRGFVINRLWAVPAGGLTEFLLSGSAVAMRGVLLSM
jgi:hypothetical protein